MVRTGALLVVHYFGAVLNAHLHLHLCMVDGVVAPGRQRLSLSAAGGWDFCAAQFGGSTVAGEV